MKKKGRPIWQCSQRKFRKEKGHKDFMSHASLLCHEPALQGHQVTWLYLQPLSSAPSNMTESPELK